MMDCSVKTLMTTRTVFLDIETTGLYADIDEILEIGVLDDDGNVLMDSLVRPQLIDTWPDAQKIHGISPADVAAAPTLAELSPRIIKAVDGVRVIIYNAAFDSRFLSRELAHAKSIACAMTSFAEVYGDWSPYHGDFTWQSLSTAAQYIGFSYEKKHRALDDCRATRAVWRYLTDPCHRADVDAERAARNELKAIEGKRQDQIRLYQKRMSSFWMRWWRIDEPDLLSPQDQEDITHTLTGYSSAVLQMMDQYPELTVYRDKSNIHPGLVSAARLKRDFAPYILKELEPEALFISSNGKTSSLLFSSEKAATKFAAHIPRFEYWKDLPVGWVTKTTARREYGVDVYKVGLQPAGEIRLHLKPGGAYTPVYDLSSELKRQA